MKGIYHIILFFFSICLTANIEAQIQVTLAEAIEIGLANNYQIRIAKERIEIANRNNNWATVGRYPRIDLNVASNNAFNRSNNPASFIPKVTNVTGGLTASVDARWTIFDGYKVKINKDRLDQLERQTEGQVEVAVQNTIQSIIVAYYQAAIQKEQLTTLEEVLNLSRDRIARQQVRAEFGQSGKFDELQAEDALLNDSTTYLIQENTYRSSLLNLRLAMGEDDVSKEYAPSEKLEYKDENYAFEDLESKMFAQNPDLKQLAMNQELALINTRLQDSNKYPTVLLGTGASFGENLFWQDGTNPFTMQEFGSDFSNNFVYYLNVTAQYNLFDGGNRKRALENAKVEERIARWNTEDLKRNLSAQLNNALENYNNQKRLISLTEKLVVNAQQNIKVAKERYDGGLISAFDYRTIQLAYVNAIQVRLNAIFNLKLTETELIRLTGGLTRG